MINMAQYHRIKWLHEREGMSERKIAAELGISRNTVRKYLREANGQSLVQQKTSHRPRGYSQEISRLLPIVDEWLKQDQSVWKKQRHTAERI